MDFTFGPPECGADLDTGHHLGTAPQVERMLGSFHFSNRHDPPPPVSLVCHRPQNSGVRTPVPRQALPSAGRGAPVPGAVLHGGGAVPRDHAAVVPRRHPHVHWGGPKEGLAFHSPLLSGKRGFPLCGIIHSNDFFFFLGCTNVGVLGDIASCECPVLSPLILPKICTSVV